LFGIGVGVPVVYCSVGFATVKSFESLSLENQQQVPKFVERSVRFFESNYRVGRCGATAACIVADYSYYSFFFKRKYKDQQVDIQERNEYFHPAYERGAQRTLKTLEDLGGIFIKLGQELSMMKGIVPDEYVAAMEKLQDNVPSISYDEVRYVIKKSFGDNVENLFQSFETEPVAAASLAQVHKAVLFDGTRVAVKIKYPKVTHFMNIDLYMHDLFSNWYGRVQPEYKINPKSKEHIYKQFKKELDFVNEAQNMKRCEKNSRKMKMLYVPFVVDKLVANDVLTMEYIDGYKVNDLKAIEQHGWDKTEIAKTILAGLADQIFIHGFVHADPHPGNIFIRPLEDDPKQCQVVLLDHGLYAEIDDDFRMKFSTFWKHVVNQDNNKLKEICDSWNITHYDLFASLMLLQSYDGVKLDSLLLEEVASAPTGDEDDGGSNPITMLIKESHLDRKRWMEMMASLPPQIHLVLRSLFISRDINVQLGNSVNRFEVMARSAISAISPEKESSGTDWGMEIRLKYLALHSYAITLLINAALKFRDLVKYFSSGNDEDSPEKE